MFCMLCLVYKWLVHIIQHPGTSANASPAMPSPRECVPDFSPSTNNKNQMSSQPMHCGILPYKCCNNRW